MGLVNYLPGNNYTAYLLKYCLVKRSLRFNMIYFPC